MKRLNALGLAAALACLQAAAADAPAYPPFGLDLAARDTATKPGADFFRFANGAYVDKLVIPADEVVTSRRSGMSRDIETRLHAILEEAAKDVPAQPADARGKVGAFYAAFMDEARIEHLGVQPIASTLEAIRKAPDLAALAALMGRANVDFLPTVFSVAVDIDLKRPERYSVYLNQSGLGLPDVDYYTKPDFAAQRAAYRAYAAKLLGLVAWPDADAAAGAILDFETRVAQCSPTRAALMTGRYPMRHGLQVGVVRPWAQYGLPLEERTLAQALKDAGYATAICGKWHLGHFNPAYLPTRRGFDHQYGHYNGALDYFTHIRCGRHAPDRDDRENRDEDRRPRVAEATVAPCAPGSHVRSPRLVPTLGSIRLG